MEQGLEWCLVDHVQGQEALSFLFREYETSQLEK